MPVADVEVDEIDHETVPQAVEQIAQRPADDKGVGDVVQLRCAALRYIITSSTATMAMAMPAKNQRCQPP